MSSDYDISVVVGTYNPNWEKLKATLLSIVEQKNLKLQIVVSDDGSANPLHTEIIDFFNHIGFCDYKLVAGAINEGTVCQYYRGFCAADAEYIKPFSPGDLLYNDVILSEWIAFAKENNADISFGDLVCYNRKGGSLNIIHHINFPWNLSIYKKDVSYRDWVINYVCLENVIYGCSKIAKKSIFLHYIKFLLHRVIYAEDYFIRLAVLDQRKILYYPNKVIWYEFADGGISSSGDKKWRELIRKDDIAMDEICLEKWNKPDKEIRSWLLELIEFKKINCPTKCEKLARYVKHPSWFYWRLYYQFFKDYTPIDAEVAFFNHCFNEQTQY